MNRLLSVLILALAPTLAWGDDWPQWRGPNRDAKSAETGLLKKWPESGPKLLWQAENLGNGYSSFAIVEGKLYSMGGDQPDVGNEQFVFCLDANTGKQIWKSASLGDYFDNAWGGGPRCTPTVDGEHLYVIYPLKRGGEIACLKCEDGSVVWKTDMGSDGLGGRLMSGWGYSESPLVDGDLVLCTPGGPRGTIAALDKKTGKEVWRSTDVKDPAGYSSIRIMAMNGVKQYVQMTGEAVIGVRAEDGKLLWRNTSLSLRTAAIPTPVVEDEANLVFATSGYGAGAVLIKLAGNGQKLSESEVYKSRDMSNHHGGVILLDGHLYGHSNGRPGWVCMDLKTGDIKWSQPKFSKGSIVYADGHFYCYGERDGKVAMIKATTKEWDQVGSLELPQKSTIRSGRGGFWSHPVVANGKLYLRDQDLMFCYDLTGE